MNDLTKSYLSIFFGSAVGLGLCVGFQRYLNAETTKNCPSIYTVKYVKSSIGPVARCTSRAKFYGPAIPLND
jgi:hypothetical protein